MSAASDDDSMPDDCTLDSLERRRMTVAKGIFGHLGAAVNIEAPLFITWVRSCSVPLIPDRLRTWKMMSCQCPTSYWPFPSKSSQTSRSVLLIMVY